MPVTTPVNHCSPLTTGGMAEAAAEAATATATEGSVEGTTFMAAVAMEAAEEDAADMVEAPVVTKLDSLVT